MVTNLQSQVTFFYDEGIQKLVPRYNNCLNNICNQKELNIYT